jgi:A/G-specific adenine glycosylase
VTVRADPDDRNCFLLEWYGVNRRPLPWRESVDPYRVMVSEAMLQQTQVQRVIPRFAAFVERWPTEDDLADATSVEVLAEWSGLGYNSRALRLRDAAGIVARDGWPTTPAGLRRLPGVGPYTANAIASICFGAQVPAVDTNLRRVISRWVGEPLDGRALESVASDLVDARAGDWNQALMDLGSSCCTATNPSCDACPVERWCEDPTVYEPPPRQTSFDGSHRQLRGALVRASVERRSLEEAGRVLGRSAAEIHDTIEELINEGLIEPDIELKAEG